MNIVSQLKVFEFAKEIGMETLALMDKIREWKLPVRSHMAELEPDMMAQIKERLEAESSPKKDAKKKVVKKASKADAEVADKPAKKVATKTATKITTKSAPAPIEKPTTKKSVAAEEAASPVVRKTAAKTLIRKKADEIEAQAKVEELTPEETPDIKADEEVDTPVVDVQVAPAKAEKAQPTLAPVEPKKVDVKEVVQAKEEPVVVPQEPRAKLPSQESTTEAKVVAKPVPKTENESVENKANLGPARKREVVMTGTGPSSGIRSEAPKRNIVGRMDLSRVQGVAQQNQSQGRPQHRGGPGGGGGHSSHAGSHSGGPSSGPRTPSAGGHRQLRTGFVAPAPVVFEEVDDAEARKKYDDKANKKKMGLLSGGAPAPSVREREEEVQHFSETEFRKREMVFQPKKKKGLLNRESKKTEITVPKASKRIVKVDQSMSVSDLALAMGVKATQITKALMTSGTMATMNTQLDFDTIALIVPEFNFEAVNVHKTVDDILVSTAFGDLDAEAQIRPPVITVMGHVDHGKTSLLDAIRKANVARGEAGGITQHIGAYQVTTEEGHNLTFIDTPGHEAFTAMRARGANVTDIVVIVVAADDGVMPQTIEAINHAKAAQVPIIVAVNKIDRPNANVDKIKQQMTEYELVPEEWGGETIFCPVSAIQKTGIPELLEQLYLIAEMEELKANPNRSATGVVIEARVDKGRGPVATLLVQDGTLKVGQSFVVGTVTGRVRSLINDKGERVDEAGPSQPVEVLGLSEAPLAGDRFDATESEADAQRVLQLRKDQAALAKGSGKTSLEDIFAKMQNKDLKELAVVLKTDVSGSVEAIKGMFEKVGNDEVKLKIIHSAVGGINESDVLLAHTAKALIVGFNVRPDGGAQQLAKQYGIEIKTYSIVYELMDDMKKALSGMLTPDVVEKSLGRAEVRNTFTVPKIGTIAGCAVVDGKITRQSQLRLVRDGKIIYTGKLSSLKRFKDDAKEVATGYECGIGIENFNDLKVGDVIEAFVQEVQTREI